MVVGKRAFIAGTKALIFDVEGTTTSISFVKDKLFPYVRENVKDFVDRQWNEEEFKEVLALLKEQAKLDVSNSIEGAVLIAEQGTEGEIQEAVVKNILWQMDRDAKTLPLKNLQGHILREGYKQGQLKGHLYPDVTPCLRAWAQSGLKLYVYSSGSVEAQKLLFGHSLEGDVLDLFEGHFDTAVGRKTDSQSYADIVKQLDYQPDEVVFFTDVPKEATAAVEAGLTAVLVVREGNTELSGEDQSRFQVIHTFEDFECDLPAKRRKVSVEVEETPAPPAEVNQLADASAAEVSGEAPSEVPVAGVEDVDMADVGVDKTEGEVDAVEVEKGGPADAAEADAVAVAAKAEGVVDETVTESKPTESDKVAEPIVDQPMKDEVEAAQETVTEEKVDAGALEDIQAEAVSNETVLKEEQEEKIEVKELLTNVGDVKTDLVAVNVESKNEVLNAVTKEADVEVSAADTAKETAAIQGETVETDKVEVVEEAGKKDATTEQKPVEKDEPIAEKVEATDSGVGGQTDAGDASENNEVANDDDKGQGDGPHVAESEVKDIDAGEKLLEVTKSDESGAGEKVLEVTKLDESGAGEKVLEVTKSDESGAGEKVLEVTKSNESGAGEKVPEVTPDESGAGEKVPEVTKSDESGAGENVAKNAD